MAGYNVTLPCKVGDPVFGIRRHNITGLKIMPGKVTEMYFIEGMVLCIVVKGVARGEWGKAIFPTYEAAQAYLDGGCGEPRRFTHPPMDLRMKSGPCETCIVEPKCNGADKDSCERYKDLGGNGDAKQ